MTNKELEARLTSALHSFTIILDDLRRAQLHIEEIKKTLMKDRDDLKGVKDD